MLGSSTDITKKCRNSKGDTDEHADKNGSTLIHDIVNKTKEITNKNKETSDQISDIYSDSYPKKQLSLKRQKTSELIANSQGFFVPSIDEFGGYSSRLRIPEIVGEVDPIKDAEVKTKKQTKK